MSDTRRIVHARMEELKEYEESEGSYEYKEIPVLPADLGQHCIASFYRIAPGKSNYPYHYHLDQEEIFYIISGNGSVKTPDGERPVSAGDILFFPAGPNGAHKLTNTSSTEELVYLDFDAIGVFDVAVYPDSDKIAVWSPELNSVFRMKDRTRYYEGEE